jgi:hypothetical protein
MDYFITEEKQLIAELEQILQSENEMTNKTKKACKLIMDTFSKFRIRIREKGFKRDEDEIYFFRNIKPKIHAYLNFFTILAEIERAKYHKSDEELKNFIDKKFRMFRYLNAENLDFVTYYMEGLTHLDRQYFLRPTDVLKITRQSATMMVDPEFSTTYDIVAADIIANQMLKKYFFPDQENLKTKMPAIPKMKWTMTKSDFIEFVYGLQASKAVNYGDVEIIELCQALQSIFKVHIEDPYRIFIDLCNRKTAPVKFIPKMEEGFMRKVEEMDRKS